jgi:hypothetical protein
LGDKTNWAKPKDYYRGGIKMFRKRPFWGIFTTIVIAILLVVGGIALYRWGYVQGYATGYSGEGESALMWPGDFHHGRAFYFARPMMFFPFSPLFGLFLFFMLIFAIKRLFWHRRWRMAAGDHPEDWKGHYGPMRHHWGPPPPWAWGEKPPAESDESQDTSEE